MEGNSRLGVVAIAIHHKCFIALIGNLGLLTLSSVHLPNPNPRIKDCLGVTMLSKTISEEENISRQARDSNNNTHTAEAEFREEKCQISCIFCWLLLGF